MSLCISVNIFILPFLFSKLIFFLFQQLLLRLKPFYFFFLLGSLPCFFPFLSAFPFGRKVSRRNFLSRNNWNSNYTLSNGGNNVSFLLVFRFLLLVKRMGWLLGRRRGSHISIKFNLTTISQNFHLISTLFVANLLLYSCLAFSLHSHASFLFLLW